MNAVAEHCAALSRLYGPDANELRQSIADGCAHAGRMASEVGTIGACDLLAAQLFGLTKTVARLREQMPEEVPHGNS